MKHAYRMALPIFVLLAACLPAAAQEEVYGEVTSRYNKEKNVTTVGIRRLELSKTADRLIIVNVDFDFPGTQQKTRPEDLFFIIQVLTAGDYIYPDLVTTPVIVDGKSVAEISLRNLDKRKIGNSSLETLGMRMETSVFERLARGSKAEIRLDKTTVIFGPTHLAKLSDLAKRLSP